MKKAITKLNRILKLLKEAGIEDVEKYRARTPGLIKVPGIVDMADYIEQTVMIKKPGAKKCLAFHLPKGGKILVDMLVPDGKGGWKHKIGINMPLEAIGPFVTVMFKK